MKMMVTLVPLLVAFIMGAQPGEASTHATVASVSTFFDDNAPRYLDHVKSHFDKSLTYLFTGNAFGDQSVQRPGLAKVLKEESDRHWNLGIDALKKYLQRGGRTPAELQPTENANELKAALGKPIPPAQEAVFREKFAFHGSNSLSTFDRNSPDFNSTYLVQFEKLVTDCKTTVVQVNDLHRMSMKRKEVNPKEVKPGDSDATATVRTPMKRNEGNHKESKPSDFDADMAHYLEEKLEKEVGLMRKFSNLYTSLEKMSSLGVAQHIFDKSLSD